jgi:type I restriction enzyme S subunit
MIDGLKPYTDYKESGQAWLGSVPRHWPVLPNRAIFAEVKDRDHPDEEMLSVTITQGIVRQKSLLSDSSKKDSSNQDKSKYKFVQPHDIAYNKMRAWQGAIGVSDLRGIISPAYIVMRLREEQNARYFHHLYRTPQFAKEAERWSYGITSDMWSLRPEHFKLIYSARPPRDEQDAIVRFLDHAHGQIERAIRAKQKLMALLNEQKQAIIHRAVTRGLNPNVPLKPSGMPFLGEVPKGWKVVRFKTQVGFQEGPGIMLADFREHGVPLLRISCLAGNEATLNGCNYLSPSKVREKWSHFAVKKGDYLLSASGSTGAVRRTTDEVIGAIPYTGIIRLWPQSDQINMEYLRLFMSAQPFADQISMAKSGVGIEHFGPTHLKRMWICLPLASEQAGIVELISKQTTPLNEALTRAEREIGLLREYRTRLVADVVTGKLDVRAAARQLPEDSGKLSDGADQSDGLDESDLSGVTALE